MAAAHDARTGDAPRNVAGTLAPDAALRQSLLGSEVMRHPAKQSIPQLIHLLDRFAVPGGVLLDCFGGSGCAMLAASPVYGKGMYVITVELASHFLAMQERAWQHFQCTLDMQDCYATPPGDYWPMQGDSRRLAALLEAETADLIITSPSYGGSEAVDKRKKQNGTIAAQGGGNAARANYTQISRMKDNGIGFDKHSQLDAKQLGYVDTIITSPPYQDAVHHEKRLASDTRRLAEGKIPASTLSHLSPNSMMTMGSYAPPIDLVVTSPPYQDSLTDGNPKRRPEQVFRELDKQTHSRILPAYDTTPENIGNERGKRYLASMREVWSGCAAVLKPGGMLCCITRDCVRDGKRVPVGQQNRDLLMAAGLELLEIETWSVDRLSFWRILQQRKNPDAPVISTEEVSIFRRPTVAHLKAVT